MTTPLAYSLEYNDAEVVIFLSTNTGTNWHIYIAHMSLAISSLEFKISRWKYPT